MMFKYDKRLSKKGFCYFTLMKLRGVLVPFPPQTKAQKELVQSGRFAEKLMRFLPLSSS